MGSNLCQIQLIERCPSLDPLVVTTHTITIEKLAGGRTGGLRLS